MPRSRDPRPHAGSGAARAGRASAALTTETRAFLEDARRAHLATASADGAPHVVPVCFAVLDAHTVAFAVDDKPKATGRTLKRLRNLAENPRFALVVDRWSERWRRLGYVLVSGTAARAADTRRRASAVRALRARYPQYREMGLDARRHEIVLLAIDRVHAWGRIAVRRPARRAVNAVGAPRADRAPRATRRVARRSRARRPHRSADTSVVR